MASENSWGAPRIHGELLRLGFDVSERSVSRYLRTLPRTPRTGQTWTTFLRNHRQGIAAMDLFTVLTATFRVLYVFFIIRHGRRDLACYSVTPNPTASCVIQQLREAFPFESAPRHLIFDRDAIFASEVVATLPSMNIDPTRTSYRSPWQNGVAERFVATARRELLDHVIVLNERHLRKLLEPFVTYYSVDRTHLGLDKDSPQGVPSNGARVRPLTSSGTRGSVGYIAATPGVRLPSHTPSPRSSSFAASMAALDAPVRTRQLFSSLPAAVVPSAHAKRFAQLATPSTRKSF